MPLLVLLGACANRPAPEQVTYVLGGMMSGPYRLTADFATGTVEEATPPPGKHGDGARLDAWTLPVTSTQKLSPHRIAEIRRLSNQVLEHGIFSEKGCPASLTVDALVSFRIVTAHGTRNFSTASPCMNEESSALQHSLYCGIYPQDHTCIGQPARRG